MKQIGEHIDITVKGRIVDIEDCRKNGGPLYYLVANNNGKVIWTCQEFIDLAKSNSDMKGSSYTNSGHGHVYPRPDGTLARCGGPGLCSSCARDKAHKEGISP